MKARHVWTIISVLAGVCCFGEVVADDGIMWGMRSIMSAMAQAAAVTALFLFVSWIVLVVYDQ